MATIYNSLKKHLLDIRQENSQNPSFLFVILVLISIPLGYAVNNVALGFLIVSCLYSLKKNEFKLEIDLLLPIGMYGLMLFSYFWSIDTSNTVKAFSKEVSLFVIPLLFLIGKRFTSVQKNKILYYYSFGIVFYAVFCLVKAIVRFFRTNNPDVFFYHELVTKDVNAIHVSVYMSVAFFCLLINKTINSTIRTISLLVLFVTIILLSSKNIFLVFLLLMLIYMFYFSKKGHQLRLRNLIVFGIILGFIVSFGKIKERFQLEFQTNSEKSISPNVITGLPKTVHNVSIKEAWTNTTFTPNDFFPGTAFRVYQFRTFLEIMHENSAWLLGFGLNASYSKIEEKAIENNLFLGDNVNEGYQKKNFHNQYVQNFADLGIMGFMILIGIVSINLKNAIRNKDFIHFAFAILMISLFLTESFLWRQRGVLFFITMYCLMNSKIGIQSPKQKI